MPTPKLTVTGMKADNTLIHEQAGTNSYLIKQLRIAMTLSLFEKNKMFNFV